jgi:SagB-type dehydrogenase family enzyme
MPRIDLPAPQTMHTPLTDVMGQRRSARGGDSRISFTFQELGTLLGTSVGSLAESGRRPFPSGGALYPIETYLISAALEREHPAVYHYNPSSHALETLMQLPDDTDMKHFAPHPPQLPLSSLLVFTSVWERSSAKYGDLAYQHALIEAGHMSQNVLLAACALGIHARPYAGFNDTLVAHHLDLDEEREQTVHSITLCKGESDTAVLFEE